MDPVINSLTSYIDSCVVNLQLVIMVPWRFLYHIAPSQFREESSLHMSRIESILSTWTKLQSYLTFGEKMYIIANFNVFYIALKTRIWAWCRGDVCCISSRLFSSLLCVCEGYVVSRHVCSKIFCAKTCKFFSTWRKLLYIQPQNFHKASFISIFTCVTI